MVSCNSGSHDGENNQNHENHLPENAVHEHNETEADHDHEHNETEADHDHEHDETEADHDHEHNETEAGHDHEHDETEAGHDHEHDETEAIHTHEHNETEAAHTHDHEHDETEAGHDHEQEQDHGEGGQLTVSSEEYTVSTVRPSEFSFIYKTAGQILPGKKDEIIITAATPGIISFTRQLPYPGTRIETGQHLFLISGNGLTDNNTDLEYIKIRSEYLSARENFERAEKLIDDKLITREHYLDSRLSYEKALAEYNIYRKTLSDAGSLVSSPSDGYINRLYVKEGEMVGAGDRIASLITGHNMVLKADIPLSDMDIAGRIRAANFTTGYRQRIFSTEEMKAEIISYGKSIGENSWYIPLYFSLGNQNELVPGSFADIWLKGEKIEGAITVPNSSLMEEYGKMYVFMAVGDTFQKRYITCGKSNGEVTHVLEGLDAGDRIVTGGTYRVKLLLQGSDLPEHGHNH